MTFDINLKVLSLNNLLRKNKWTCKRATDEAKEAAFYAIKQAKLKPIKQFPVVITFHAVWKNKIRRDVDDLFTKPIVDQLVRSGILPDDSLAYVSKVVFTGEIGMKRDHLVVHIDLDPTAG